MRGQFIALLVISCLLADSVQAFSFSPLLQRFDRTSQVSSCALYARVKSPSTPIAMTMALTKPEETSAEAAFVTDLVPQVVKPAVADAKETNKEIETPLIESECGADYIPLLTALQLGSFEEADQLTRDLLIWIGGEGVRKRGFVYYAEAPKLPMKDMQTIDRLWLAYSAGKFGFSVQKQIWNQASVNGDYGKFVQAVEWTLGPCGGCEKVCSGCTGTLKRWTAVAAGGNQYCYDLKKAKKGHLPLTSALRGNQLLRNLLAHRAFGTDAIKGSMSVMAANAAAVADRPGMPPKNEKLFSKEELRLGDSPYTAAKKPWDV